jgi:hypothetical protein
MKRIYKVFGIEVFSVEYEGLDEEAILSLGGSFDLAEQGDEEEWEEEDPEFGFRAQS